MDAGFTIIGQADRISCCLFIGLYVCMYVCMYVCIIVYVLLCLIHFIDFWLFTGMKQFDSFFK